MRIEDYAWYFEIKGDADGVTLTIGEQNAFNSFHLSPDEARQVWTDLGETLGRFEVAE